MRGVKGHVHKPRFSRWRFLDETQCGGGDQVGGVTLFMDRAGVVMPVAFAIAFVREIIDRAVVTADERREAVGQGEKLLARVAEVPFTDDAAPFVTEGSKQFR